MSIIGRLRRLLGVFKEHDVAPVAPLDYYFTSWALLDVAQDLSRSLKHLDGVIVIKVAKGDVTALTAGISQAETVGYLELAKNLVLGGDRQ